MPKIISKGRKQKDLPTYNNLEISDSLYSPAIEEKSERILNGIIDGSFITSVYDTDGGFKFVSYTIQWDSFPSNSGLVYPVETYEVYEIDFDRDEIIDSN
jgi:hypothetical protein